MTIFELANVPAGTAITAPMVLQIHQVSAAKSGVSGGGKEWSNQGIKVGDPGAPEENAIWATVWGGLDMRQDVGKTIQVTPGSKGSGIKVEEWNGAKKLNIAASSANIQIVAAAPATQQPIQVQQPVQQQQPDQAQQQQPAQASEPGYVGEVQGNAPIQQVQQPVQQPVQQQMPHGLEEMRTKMLRHGLLFAHAFDASTYAWSQIAARQGVAPDLRMIEKLATGMLLTLANDMTNGGPFGSGAKNMLAAMPENGAPTKTPQTTAAQLVQQHYIDLNAIGGSARPLE